MGGRIIVDARRCIIHQNHDHPPRRSHQQPLRRHLLHHPLPPPHRSRHPNQHLVRRWRHLHESTQSINFDIDELLAMDGTHVGRYTVSADLLFAAELMRRRVEECVFGFDQFLRRLPEKSIQSFRIHVCSTEPHLVDRIASWIGFAIQRRVRELDIDLSGTRPAPSGFPTHLLQEGREAPSLKQLSHRCCKLLRGCDFSGFSSLTSLNLCDVYLTGDFLSHCRNLEELSLRDCRSAAKLKISLQLLKHLKVYCPDLEIEVACAKNLVSFECSEPLPDNLRMGSLTVPLPGHVGEGFNLLSELVLHRIDLMIPRIGHMLAEFPNLAQLRLQECAIWWSKIEVYRLKIAGLVRLKHLEVCDCRGVSEVQVCASGLTTLVFLSKNSKSSYMPNSSYLLLDGSGNEFCSAAGRVSPLKYLHLRNAQFPVDLQNFRSITTITLEKVHLEETNVSDILSDCLLLERLSITNCSGLFLLGIVGPSLKLKYLRVSNCEDLEDLKISAENLATFEYHGYVINFSFIEAPELVQVEMNIDEETDHQYMVPVLTALTNLSRLHTLRLYIDQAQIPTSLPLFECLKHLDLCIGRGQADNCDFSWVDYLLMASPFLHKLQLEFRQYFDDREEGPLPGGDQNQLRKVELWRFRGIKKEMLLRYLRNDTEEGPLIGGIHNHLEEIQVCGFRGIMKEIDFVIRLMHNAKELKLMKINPRPNFHFGAKEWDDEILLEWVKHGRLRTRSQLARQAPPGVEIVIQ